ncbi:AAA family ATPase [uncultured Subdoligranulum sp.]|uniref:AAA family ATPase n=1 Tax=uncultured Subdoligranulum sp. TaxID=512298 RepID=UPI002628EF59|nr:AAA family ATPase [uncultured Subdoligranulum sp.]
MNNKYSYSEEEYLVGGNGSVADAIYRKAKATMDTGNPYIEALPYPITERKELVRHYEKGLNRYSPEDRKLPRSERRFLVSQLRAVRVALPFEQDLETEFYRTLCESYRLRKTRDIYIDGVKRKELCGDVSEAANTGFNMLGFSGCGKSSAIKLLISRYPQVIRHYFGEEVFSQIVYLVVSCQPNSNFAALYSSIGKAIDFALQTDVYQKQIDKIKTLAGKMNKIIELIRIFGIGTIILDEIQLIDFSSTKEASFEALMVITNETKMAFCVVGTTEAYVKMFKHQRTARRVGMEIRASVYCENRNYFNYVMSRFFAYQWFDERIELTNELCDAFYEESKGIVDQAVSLYIAVQDEYLKSQRNSIDGKFVADVSKKRYPNLKRLLKRIGEPGVQEMIEQIMRKSKEEDELELNKNKQEALMQAIVQNAKETDITSLVRRTIASIQTVVGSLYDEEAIESACKKIASDTNLQDINENDFIKDVFSFLQTGKKKSKSTSKKKRTYSHVDMLNDILESSHTATGRE